MATKETHAATAAPTSETPLRPAHPDVRVGVARRNSESGIDQFDTVEWEIRDAIIPGKDGPSFEQRGVDFPTTWSQTATNIVAQKYFRGKLGAPERERSVRQMIGRVADTITAWGRKDSYFADAEEADAFHAELVHLLLYQKAAFNSPVWFNVGFEERPQASACFILSIDDSMDAILEWISEEGRIFRGGSGLGHQPLAPAVVQRAALEGRLRVGARQLHARRRCLGRHDQVGRQDAACGQDGRARRRPPRHRGVHLVQVARGGEGARAPGCRLRHEPRLVELVVDPVPEREQLGPPDATSSCARSRSTASGASRPARRVKSCAPCGHAT